MRERAGRRGDDQGRRNEPPLRRPARESAGHWARRLPLAVDLGFASAPAGTAGVVVAQERRWPVSYPCAAALDLRHFLLARNFSPSWIVEYYTSCELFRVI